MCRVLGALALLFLFAIPAKAQVGARADGIVLDQIGHPIAGAQVRVCSSPSTGQMPCAVVANIFSDVNLTQPLQNPITTDQNGNYFFYIQGGSYELEFFGQGVVTTQLPDQTITLPLQSSPTFINVTITGTLSVAGAASFTNITGNPNFTGNPTFSGLTVGNCVQAGAGGALTTVLVPCNSGATIGGTVSSTQVAFGASSNSITGASGFTFAANLLTVPSVLANPFTSSSSNPALTGAVRLASTDSLCLRNNANTNDLCVSKTAGDLLQYNAGSFLFTNSSPTITGNWTFNTPIVSGVGTGSAPFSVASTTLVPNLNANLLVGQTWAIPAAIGTTTPAAGTFTNLTDTSLTVGRCVQTTTGGLFTVSAQACLNPPTIKPNYGKGTSLCTTSGSSYATCTTPQINFVNTQPDTNYAVSCTGIAPSGFPYIAGITARTTTGVEVIIANGTSNGATASTYTEVDCVVLE